MHIINVSCPKGGLIKAGPNALPILNQQARAGGDRGQTWVSAGSAIKLSQPGSSPPTLAGA